MLGMKLQHKDLQEELAVEAEAKPQEVEVAVKPLVEAVVAEQNSYLNNYMYSQ